MNFVSILEAGRRDFLNATRDVSPDVAIKSIGGGWSVLECVEHVVAAEERYLQWMSAGETIEPRRDSEKELRLFTVVRSRLTKFDAPEAVRPCGRFDTLEAALDAFKLVRDRSVQMVRELGDAIFSVGVTHPYFGNLNGAELMQLVDGHARRHADQIREIADK